MKSRDLRSLDRAVEIILKEKKIRNEIEYLKRKIKDSNEPFLWYVIDIHSIQQDLPSEIRSGWIFALKKDTPSVAHYHPNSIQHTVMIEGEGKVKVGKNTKDLLKFDPQSSSINDVWCIIDTNIPHEFFPSKEDMVVVSFHTCSAEELIEVKCASNKRRRYL